MIKPDNLRRSSQCPKPEDVRGRRLYKKQGKSDRWVVVPLREEAYKIIILRFNKSIPQVSNAKINEYIKEVARIAGIDNLIKFSHKKGNQDIEVEKPKCEWTTSHTCRRSNTLLIKYKLVQPLNRIRGLLNQILAFLGVSCFCYFY